jgi:hypothetical protein
MKTRMQPIGNIWSKFPRTVRDVATTVNGSSERFHEVIAMFARLRSAWSQVERTVIPTQPTERLRVSSGRQAAISKSISESSEPPPGSGSSKWSA